MPLFQEIVIYDFVKLWNLPVLVNDNGRSWYNMSMGQRIEKVDISLQNSTFKDTLSHLITESNQYENRLRKVWWFISMYKEVIIAPAGHAGVRPAGINLNLLMRKYTCTVNLFHSFQE